MTNQANQLVLKSVRQLFEYDFFIPSYQRGYRWTKTQVTQLLSDIWEFSRRDEKKRGEFYCLQPIVAKKRDDGQWEVIDGQQRLTTMFIILKYLENTCKALTDDDFSSYSICYSTRKDSAYFLDNIKRSDLEFDNNIDYFFMQQAYQTIKEWFEDKENKVVKHKFTSTLIEWQVEEEIDVYNNVRVIWYEVEDRGNNNSIDIFTRLNIGKIPLTNAELIKALFLQKGNFSEGKSSLKQIQIASEWDTIERTLQDDAFWFFIYNPDNPLKYDNRIEYIFDLMKKRTKDSEYHHTFNEFCRDFVKTTKNNKPEIDKIWLEIKQYFLTFEEWFRDYELFHYVGYLVDCGMSINTIKDNSFNEPKDKFKEVYLKGEIRNQVKCDLDKIGYKNGPVKKILLLFNIQTILETQKSDMRFPFHKYKSEDWDIEHVCSQTDKNISPSKRLAWVDDILEYFTGSTDMAVIETCMEKLDEKEEKDERQAEAISICRSLLKLKTVDKIEKADEDFGACLTAVRKYFKEDNQTEERDDISNLALLDAPTNRSYGNSFFPIKRQRIIKNDRNGIFVPIATKNLFLKYYSRQLADVMFWSGDDAKDYLNAIKNTLAEFLPKDKK